MSSSFDVIIVGLGAMGSSAAYQLSKTKKRVLGIDQFSPPHNFGSSHGDTRITRQAIGEGRQYTPLVLRANEIWKEIEARTGEILLTQCGGLIFGDAECATRSHGTESFLSNTIEAAKEFKIEHEILDYSNLAVRFPQFMFHGTEIGYYEPGAGFLRPEKCIANQLQLAQQNGVELKTDTEVLAIEPKASGDGVSITTRDGVFCAEFLVLSAGAWISNFVSDEFKKQFEVYRQILFWFEPEAPIENFSANRFPVFIRLGENPEDMFYGFPALDGVSGGLKIASEEFDKTCSPSALNKLVSEKEESRIRQLASRYFKVNSRCLRSAVCMYTVTPDCGFVIDRLPTCPQIIVASPCSGHGFKHSAAVGSILKELVVDGESTLDISRFSFARLKAG